MRLPTQKELEDCPHDTRWLFSKWDHDFARNFLLHFVQQKGLNTELEKFVGQMEAFWKQSEA